MAGWLSNDNILIILRQNKVFKLDPNYAHPSFTVSSCSSSDLWLQNWIPHTLERNVLLPARDAGTSSSEIQGNSGGRAESASFASICFSFMYRCLMACQVFKGPVVKKWQLFKNSTKLTDLLRACFTTARQNYVEILLCWCQVYFFLLR